VAGVVKDRPDWLAIVGKITTGVKRLESLVGQVLQFSRETRISPAPCDLAELVGQAMEYASPTLEKRDVRCIADGPAAMPINVDPLLIGQSILNLLLNAAEAIEGGGTVTLCYRPPEKPAEARQFVLQVKDSGSGIPADLLDKIFNPFFTTKDEGTGLGLAIVHRIVEAHEGTITASNESGGGATFEIRI
jgi:signal transduction histidine kinase